MLSRTTRENIPYQLEGERHLPPEQRSTFLLATLPNHLMLTILELSSQQQHQKWIELALKAGLRGWENFPDAEGRPTPFLREEGRTRNVHGAEVKSPVRSETIELIPSKILLELANAIVGANQLKDEDVKN